MVRTVNANTFREASHGTRLDRNYLGPDGQVQEGVLRDCLTTAIRECFRASMSLIFTFEFDRVSWPSNVRRIKD
jgi:hypothetical protein